ncbi:hypothetical protein V7S43_016957 [Phytophthora oleae]|uniref:Uncharacterized protein n=1 Tax=Phytophthora oleae TaxID=2107226 RepID=A0ABD3EYS2_9STRA
MDGSHRINSTVLRERNLGQHSNNFTQNQSWKQRQISYYEGLAVIVAEEVNFFGLIKWACVLTVVEQPGVHESVAQAHGFTGSACGRSLLHRRRAMYDVNDSTQFASENWKLCCRTLERNRCIDGPRTSVAPKHYGKCRPSAGPYQQNLQEQEKDLLRAFRARLYSVQEELESEKNKRDDGASA